MSAEPRDFFSAAYVARADGFRGPQSLLALISSALALLMAVVVAWRLAGIRRAAARAGAWAAAAVGAGITAAALLATLPLELWMLARARRVGLVVQPPGDWLMDWLLFGLIAVTAVTLLALLLRWLIGHFERAWWAPLAVVVVVVAVAFQALAPLLIEPLFAQFTPVAAGPQRDDVEMIAQRSGVRAGEILSIDASRRTSAANAYVAGLGSTKRVVLYDTLLHDYGPRQRRAVVAHEFGHARHRDLWMGLLWLALVAPAAAFCVSRASGVLAARGGIEPASPAGVAIALASCACVVAISQPAANAYSRSVERRADAFALRVTGDPAAAVALERRLTMQNLGRPEPPAGLQFLFGTHPAPMERIGMALGYAREHELPVGRPAR